MKGGERLYLLHVRDEIRKALNYTRGGREAFFAHTLIQDAVLRNIGVIGEAVKNLGKDFRDAHPNVPWREVAGMRDVLIHHYFRINLDTVWSVIESKLPVLLANVETLLVKLPADPDDG